jgi:hypothetical protein
MQLHSNYEQKHSIPAYDLPTEAADQLAVFDNAKYQHKTKGTNLVKPHHDEHFPRASRP